jgi:uncharacterized membrane protein (UPF0127 family)
MSESKRIVNLTRGGEDVCIAELADGPLRRMRGLIGRRGLPEGQGLLLRPAPAIHTGFMRFSVDALFLDRDLTVVDIVPRLDPWRVASSRHARSVLELAAGEAARRGVQVGDRLELRDRDQPRSVVAALSRLVPGAPDDGEQDDAGAHALRVVVISDDRRFRAVMSVLLARRGCEVTTSSSAGRMEDVVARARAEVLVLDVGEGTAARTLAARLGPVSGIVLVGEQASEPDSQPAVYAKWGSFAELHTLVLSARDESSHGVRR